MFLGRRKPFSSVSQRLTELLETHINDEDNEGSMLTQLIDKSGGLDVALEAGILFQQGGKLHKSWRLQSATFRSAMQAAKQGTKMSDGSIDDRVLCNYCGRKFRADVA